MKKKKAPKKKQEVSLLTNSIRFSQSTYAFAIQTGGDMAYVLLAQKRKGGRKWMPDITSVEDIKELAGTKKMSTLNVRDAIRFFLEGKMNTLLFFLENLGKIYSKNSTPKRKKKSPPKKLKRR